MKLKQWTSSKHFVLKSLDMILFQKCCAKIIDYSLYMLTNMEGIYISFFTVWGFNDYETYSNIDQKRAWKKNTSYKELIMLLIIIEMNNRMRLMHVYQNSTVEKAASLTCWITLQIQQVINCFTNRHSIQYLFTALFQPK